MATSRHLRSTQRAATALSAEAPHGRIPTVGVRFATFDCLPVGKRLAVRSVSDHIARIDSAAGAVVAVVPAKVIKQADEVTAGKVSLVDALRNL